MRNEKLLQLKEKVTKMIPEIENEIYEICESLNYTNSSKFSYNIDNFRRFTEYLLSFEIIESNEKE